MSTRPRRGAADGGEEPGREDPLCGAERGWKRSDPQGIRFPHGPYFQLSPYPSNRRRFAIIWCPVQYGTLPGGSAGDPAGVPAGCGHRHRWLRQLSHGKGRRKMGIPTAVHESNAVPGLTTELLEPYAGRIMVGLKSCRKHYKHPERRSPSPEPRWRILQSDEGGGQGAAGRQRWTAYWISLLGVLWARRA